MSNGAARILAERVRQKQVEGYSSKHDDRHKGCELAQAAAAYTLAGRLIAQGTHPLVAQAEAAKLWPWSDATLKVAADPAANFVKAGALLAAEVDRLERLPRCGGCELPIAGSVYMGEGEQPQCYRCAMALRAVDSEHAAKAVAHLLSRKTKGRLGNAS